MRKKNKMFIQDRTFVNVAFLTQHFIKISLDFTGELNHDYKLQ